MQISTRKIICGDTTEIYITASPACGVTVDVQAEQMFSAIAKVLRENNASIFQERVFCRPQVLEQIKSLREQLYGKLNDGVEPTWLEVRDAGITGAFAGATIHAIAADVKPEVIKFRGRGCGRKISAGGVSCLGLSDIQGSDDISRAAQAGVIIEKAEAILQLNGMDFKSVARTWMWLGNMLEWYDDFNRIRNEFFIKKGMIRKGESNEMPASTGISVGPIGKGACTMDLIAVDSQINYLEAGSNQKSAYEYGSAFSRATEVKMPAGNTVYVSGTASIDEAGNTTNLDDADNQIANTIKNVRAIFAETSTGDGDVVNAIIYCKTPEIEKLFLEKYSEIDWPYMTAVTDICRDDLLFEIEATAVKQ